MKKDLKILEFSDVHLGHNKCPTLHIVENLTKNIINFPNLGDVDIIFIAGDFFDRLLTLPDPDVDIIKFWINKLLYRCKELDIVLRVLEGTPSHDWKQSKQFANIDKMASMGCDVKFVETLCIETIDKFGIDVLYVPDEWRPENDDTWIEVKNLLNEKGIDSVDFAVMHGSFTYQLPPHVRAPIHDEERYLSIVRGLVFIGHIHKHSTYERIISAGSFDRLAHNEEEDKGFVLAEVSKGYDYKVQFHVNEEALTFKTIKCGDMDLDTNLIRIGEIVSKLRPGSHVRISADETNPILTNIDELRKSYPLIHFTSKKEKDKEKIKEVLLDFEVKYEPINITSSNIKELLMGRMMKSQSGEVVKVANRLIDGFI